MESLRNSDDFKELLSIFNEESAKYLIVGAFALAHYGQPRYTKDLDIWVDPDDENAERVFRALAKFGAPLEGLTVADFSDVEAVVQIGVEPLRIDILPGISGVNFSEAWERRESSTYANVPVGIIGKQDYIRNKRASGRPHDLRDVEALLEGETGSEAP